MFTCKFRFENGNLCGKIFTRNFNLKRHMEIHLENRPFQCNICNQSFRQKAHLHRHKASKNHMRKEEKKILVKAGFKPRRISASIMEKIKKLDKDIQDWKDILEDARRGR